MEEIIRALRDIQRTEREFRGLIRLSYRTARCPKDGAALIRYPYANVCPVCGLHMSDCDEPTADFGPVAPCRF